MTDIEQRIREQFALEASAVPALPRNLWLRIVEGPAAGVATWLKVAPVAVAVLFIAAVGMVLARAPRATPPKAGPVASATASPHTSGRPQTTATAGTAARPSASPAAPGSTFTCGATPSGGSARATGNLTAVRVGHQPGYDRVTFEFAGSGVPAYTISQQGNAHFTQDPSGRGIDLQGIAGLRVVFHNASGSGTYTGSDDIKLAPGGVPDKSSIVEVRELGDFERVMSWGIGLNVKPACLKISELTGAPRLVVDVQDNP